MPGGETGTETLEPLPHDAQQVPHLPGQKEPACAVNWVVHYIWLTQTRSNLTYF